MMKKRLHINIPLKKFPEEYQLLQAQAAMIHSILSDFPNMQNQ